MYWFCVAVLVLSSGVPVAQASSGRSVSILNRRAAVISLERVTPGSSEMARIRAALERVSYRSARHAVDTRRLLLEKHFLLRQMQKLQNRPGQKPALFRTFIQNQLYYIDLMLQKRTIRSPRLQYAQVSAPTGPNLLAPETP